MKNLLLHMSKVLLILTFIFIGGLLLPMLLSAFLSTLTCVTLEECIITFPFWTLTLLNWFILASIANNYIK